MTITVQARLSDSPYVESITYGRTLSDGAPSRPAEANWHMVLSRREDVTEFAVVGPWLWSGTVTYSADAEILWIRFKLGTFMPHLPTRSLRDTEVVLSPGAFDTFRLNGTVYQYPNYDNIDTFVDCLVRTDLLAVDPLIRAVLQDRPVDVSPRTVRHRFLHSVGVSQKRLQQIERAQRAASMLQSGTSILDTAFELGYYDQSHLTNSLKKFIGKTPSQLVEMTQPTLPFFPRHTSPHWFTLDTYPVLRKKYKRDGDAMKRILLTGLSGTGKSAVITALAARGYKAIDADYDEFSEWVPVSDDSNTPGEPVEPNRDWVWREDRIQALLSNEDADVLFVSGCSPNMGKFLRQFDHVILLSAPTDVIVERLSARTNNPYGKNSDEVARELGLVETVEPLLRRVAGHEIDTSAPLGEVVAKVLQVAQLQE